MEFGKSVTKNQLSSFGQGAITDGTWKLTVNVSVFNGSTIEMGTYVTVTGTINIKGKSDFE